MPPGSVPSRTISGRLVGEGEGFHPAEYRVVISVEGREVAAGAIDDSGRFSLRLPRSDAPLLHVTIAAPWGSSAGEATLDGMGTGDVDLDFEGPLSSEVAAAPELEPAPRPPQPILTERMLTRFYEVVSRAESEGAFRRPFGPLEDTGWLHIYEGELEEMLELSERILRGDDSRRSRLEQLLEDAPPFQGSPDADHPHHAARRPGPIRAQGVGRLVAAALTLELPDASERAAGFFLTRFSAIARALASAEAYRLGRLSAHELEARVRAAGPGSTHHDGEGADDDHAAGAAENEPLLETATRELAHCLSVLVEAGRDLVEAADLPVPVERVDPAAVCSGYEGNLRLLPREGAELPDRPPGESLFALWDGESRWKLPVAEWGSDGILVPFPSGAAPGCGGVLWVPPARPLHQRLTDEAAARDESCRPFLLHGPTRASTGPVGAGVAIVGRPAIRLTAGGRSREVAAQAGEPVDLEWRIDTAGCGNPARKVTLQAGGEVLADDAGSQGHLIVAEQVTTTYALSAESSAGRLLCGSGRSEVTVLRRQKISVTVPDRVYGAGDPVPVTVSCAYPNPDAPVEVEVRSSDPELIPSVNVTIPVGDREATAYVPAGSGEGKVDLATKARRDDGGGGDEEPADGGRAVRVGGGSCVEPRYGGTWQTVPITVTEPGDPCPPATFLQQGGSGQLGLAGARLSDMGSSLATIPDCWLDTGSAIEACSVTEAAEQAACDAAHAQRVGACTVTCTAFTDCDSMQCTAFTDCDSIQCTSFTNCDDFWPTDPRRYACYAPRGVCVAGAAVARTACWVARAACIAAAAVSRAACWAARATCIAAAAAATAACVAALLVVLAACKALAWTKSVACKAAAVVSVGVCIVAKAVVAAANLAAALVHIAVGVVLNTAGAIVEAGCGLGRAVGLLGAPSPTTSRRLKVVGIHVAVLHTGKVLLFNYDEGNIPVTSENPANPAYVGDSDRALCALWDPVANTATYVPLNRNLFCSGHCFDAEGRLFVAGGQFRLPGLLKSIVPPRPLAPGADKDLHLFDPITETWTRFLLDMEFGRWYPTCVTMSDGQAVVASGTNAIATAAGFGGSLQHTWKVVDPTSRTFTRDQFFHAGHPPIFHTYPFMHTLPSKEVFIHYKRITRFLGHGGWGLLSRGEIVRRLDEGAPDVTRWRFSRTGPGPGTSCLLPMVPKRDPESGAVTYPAGRILILGGGGAEGTPDPPLKEPYDLNSTTCATKTAEVLDLSERPMRWRYTGRNSLNPGEPTESTSPMKFRRVMPDTVLLPDATVLIVNGAQRGQSGGFLSHLQGAEGKRSMGATDPVQAPERFDPDTETWEVLCPKTFERLYHATAVLLPDARVLVAGHDGFLNMPPHDASQYELEVFSPPYLHRGPRPTISSAPETVTYGSTFTIGTPNATTIGSVCLIRQSSTTHQINTDQRYVGLAIVPPVGDSAVVVQAPPNGGVAPPGWYMLFVVDKEKIPSIACWIQVRPGSA